MIEKHKEILLNGVNPTHKENLLTGKHIIKNIDTIEPALIWAFLEHILHSRHIGTNRKKKAIERCLKWATGPVKESVLRRSIAWLGE